MASVQGGLAMYAIYAYGTEAQKERWLPAMARGEAIGCFGLTEPDHGSDPGGMETRARDAGGDYVLSGVKRWITNGSIADVAIVWAKTAPDDEIRGFLVERGTPGLQRPRPEGQVLAARVDHVGARARGRAAAGVGAAAGRRRAEGPVRLPQPGALRHRVGRDRRRDGVLRDRARLRARTACSSIVRSPGSSSCSRSSST